MNKQLLIAGALLGLVGGVSGVACSSGGGGTGVSGTAGSSTTGSPSTTTGSPSTTTGSPSTTTGMGGSSPATTTTGMGGTSTAASTTGAGGTTTTTTSSSSSGECSKVTTLHPPNLDAGPGTIYCPFSATTDGGKNEYCTPETQHCCETPEGATEPSACTATGTACPTGSTDWGCEDPVSDCPSGQVCCAPGASIGLGTPGCGNFAHKMTGTACVAAGSCTGITLCTSDSECPSGMTCTPFGKAGNDVGGCM